MEQLPQNVLDIIAAAVAQATRQTVEVLQQQAPERNYFKITEKLLYSYPTLKRIVSDKAAYTRVELQGRSGVVRFNPNKAWKSPDDILEDMEKDKEAEYDITAKEFKRLDRVIQAFKDRKEFAVIRLYYFKERADGTPLPEDAQEMTWEEVSFQIDKGLKTVIRWRNEIINDMAICLFGIDAAIQAGTDHKKKE